MAKRKQVGQGTTDETVELKSRLEETEETLRAIRQYMVDAFVVTRSNGVEVVTLSDADFPYRMMVESMNEGAVTLIADGTIFYCNPRFAEMVQVDPEKLAGIRFRDLIRPEEQSAFDELLAHARSGARGEFCLQPPHEKCAPVQLSAYRLPTDEPRGVSILVTDITERIQAEEKIRTLASQLTMAEHQERQRISQVLHDDLQQRLFAIRTQLMFLTNDSEKNGISPALYKELKQVQRWLLDVIGITRSLSIDLSPVPLQGEGLSEAILWLCSQMKNQYGLQVQLEAKDEFINLDNQVRVLLFQILRELLFNIVKHSDSSEATITLEQIHEKAHITISDSGKGFDVRTVMNDPKAAHGLLIIQDRLSLMGGSMKMTSEPGRGTKVTIEAPLG
jgi:two-component system NarL family sensor kinase